MVNVVVFPLQIVCAAGAAVIENGASTATTRWHVSVQLSVTTDSVNVNEPLPPALTVTAGPSTPAIVPLPVIVQPPPTSATNTTPVANWQTAVGPLILQTGAE